MLILCQKSAKITLYGNWNCSAQKQVHKSLRLHMKNNGQTYLCLKRSLLIWCLVQTVNGGRKITVVFFTVKSIFGLWQDQICLFFNHLIQHWTCWIYLDLDLNLVFFIMQNNQFTREWNEADWLDPLIPNQQYKYLCPVACWKPGLQGAHDDPDWWLYPLLSNASGPQYRQVTLS